jgi:hypothetical protein
MVFMHQIRRLTFAVLTGAAFVVGVLSAPVVSGALTPAAAQISDDAQIALEQYGSWQPHPRFGEVWVPAAVPPDWRPYQYGHWVYTDEWGWYWVSDDVEADWGWVVYHYGRWAFEQGFGWYWVPGDEWAPAWVDWRYGQQYSGWAPLPPDELIGTYALAPIYWVFVPTRFIALPRWRTYIVPPYRRDFVLRQTNIVNRTVPVHGRLAVNPGISPAFVARVSGAPVSTYRVRPRVFASTQGVAGAVQIRREDLRDARGRRPGGPPGSGAPGGPASRPGGPARLGAVFVERTNTLIRPNTAVAAPQPLGKDERGRLGNNPPRAAQGTPPVVPLQQQPPAGTSPPPSPPPSGAPATTAPPPTAPTTAPAERREERPERLGPGASPGGPPPQQPNIVRPVPPPPPPPPAAPPPPQQQHVRPPPPPPPAPPPQQHVQPPPPQQQRQVQPPPPPAARPPGPPPGVRPPGPPPQSPGVPPKKPPPKPGEKPPEPPK